MEIKFTWDPKKAKRNLQKHGVSFETGTLVFADPFRYVLEDCEQVDGELSFHAIGFADGELLLLVVFVDRSEDEKDIFHIISARKATGYEREIYASQFT